MRSFLILSDLCLVWTSACVALWFSTAIRSAYFGEPRARFPRGSAGFVLLLSILTILFAETYGLYRLPLKNRLRRDLVQIAKSVFCAGLIAGLCIYLWEVRTIPAGSLAGLVIATSLSLITWRAFIRSQSISGLTEEKNVLIVGCGPNGESLRRHLEQNPEIGYVFKGYVDRRQTGRPPDPQRNKEEGAILGPVEQLPAIVRAHFIDEIFISVPSDRHMVKRISQYARSVGLNMRVVPDLYDRVSADHAIEYVGHFPTMTINRLAIPTVQLIVKRLLDVSIAALLLILLLPLLLLITAIVKLDSPGPVLYKSLRIGKKGKTFLCCKFRTMVVDAEARKDELMHLNERKGILFKISSDPRLTRVGRFLRKYSLDELPQLWNVLKQDMSLVGPRPCIPGEYNQYQLEHLRRLDVSPGVTGLWQVMARRDPSFDSYIALDNEYVNHWNLGLDCKILLRTIGVVLQGTGQ